MTSPNNAYSNKPTKANTTKRAPAQRTSTTLSHATSSKKASSAVSKKRRATATASKARSTKKNMKKASPFQLILHFVDSNKFFVSLCLSLILFISILIGVIVHNANERARIDSIEEYVDAACLEFDVPKAVVMAVIKTESDFDIYAESHANARGLMQITKITLQEINNRMGTNYRFGQMFDPQINIRCGVFYLSYLYERFDGYDDTVFAAYNAGPTRVDEWLRDTEYSKDGKTLEKIPDGYEETRNYVKKVNRYIDDYQ